MTTNDQPESNRDNSTTRRLFFAVEIDQPRRDVITDVTTRLQKGLNFTGAKIAWVPEENFHVTLYFLGDIPNAQADQLASMLPEAVAEMQGFNIDVRHLRTFPEDPKQPPKVLWVGCHQPPAELLELRRRAAQLIVRAKLPLPEQDFTPHITVARFKSTKDWKAVKQQIRGYEFFKAGLSNVSKLILMESITGGGPAKFVPYATAALLPSPKEESKDN